MATGVSIAIGLGIATGAGIAIGAGNSTHSWTQRNEPSLAKNTSMLQTQDHRCSSITLSEMSGSPTELSLREAFAKRGISLHPAVPALGTHAANIIKHPFERDLFAGSVVVTQRQDKSRHTWQLQACFYRKRDAHVCEDECGKFFGRSL